MADNIITLESDLKVFIYDFSNKDRLGLSIPCGDQAGFYFSFQDAQVGEEIMMTGPYSTDPEAREAARVFVLDALTDHAVQNEIPVANLEVAIEKEVA